MSSSSDLGGLILVSLKVGTWIYSPCILKSCGVWAFFFYGLGFCCMSGHAIVFLGNRLTWYVFHQQIRLTGASVSFVTLHIDCCIRCNRLSWLCFHTFFFFFLLHLSSYMLRSMFAIFHSDYYLMSIFEKRRNWSWILN